MRSSDSSKVLLELNCSYLNAVASVAFRSRYAGTSLIKEFATARYEKAKDRSPAREYGHCVLWHVDGSAFAEVDLVNPVAVFRMVIVAAGITAWF